MVRNPCLSCHLLNECKNNDVCLNCKQRQEYTKHISSRPFAPIKTMTIEGDKVANKRAKVDTKFCPECLTDLPSDAFNLSEISSDGLAKICKECSAEKLKQMALNPKSKPVERMKKCTKCGKELPVSKFSKKSSNADGLDYNCKDCKRKYTQDRVKKKNKNNNDISRHIERIAPRENKHWTFKPQIRTAPKNNVQEGKERVTLLPLDVLVKHLTAAYEEGVIKYNRESWRDGFNVSVLMDAAFRHMIEFFYCGCDIDASSPTQKHHLSGAIFSLISILHTLDTRPELDDRFSKKVNKNEK